MSVPITEFLICTVNGTAKGRITSITSAQAQTVSHDGSPQTGTADKSVRCRKISGSFPQHVRMKRRKMQLASLISAGIVLVGVAATFVVSLTAPRPDNLGAVDGRLADPPSSPNCVSTQTEDRTYWMAPLNFAGPPEDAIAELAAVVTAMKGSVLIEQSEHYLCFEFRSPFFRFVDDVEFLAEPETGRIHFRSASRVGYSDMGVNRARMERIRTLFRQRQNATAGKSKAAVSAPPL